MNGGFGNAVNARGNNPLKCYYTAQCSITAQTNSQWSNNYFSVEYDFNEDNKGWLSEPLDGRRQSLKLGENPSTDLRFCKRSGFFSESTDMKRYRTASCVQIPSELMSRWLKMMQTRTRHKTVKRRQRKSFYLANLCGNRQICSPSPCEGKFPSSPEIPAKEVVVALTDAFVDMNISVGDPKGTDTARRIYDESGFTTGSSDHSNTAIGTHPR